MIMISRDRAIIVQHCAVFGRLETPVRSFRVGEACPYAQHPCSITVSFQRPRGRRWSAFRIVPDDIRYLTIEIGGREVYDSREDVPCDMAKWVKTRGRFEKEDGCATEVQR